MFISSSYRTRYQTSHLYRAYTMAIWGRVNYILIINFVKFFSLRRECKNTVRKQTYEGKKKQTGKSS